MVIIYMEDYLLRYDFDKRRKDNLKVLGKYTDRIPVGVFRHGKERLLPCLINNKYLVPNDMFVGQFLYCIRRKLEVNSKKAIFIFCGEYLPPTNMLMIELYNEEKNEDLMLYLEYIGENTFGKN